MRVLFRASRPFKELEVLLEPRDIWVGVFWKRHPKALELYICVLPLLPIRLYYQWGR